MQILTPSKCEFLGEAERLTVRAESGDMTVLPGHIPYCASVKGGKGTIVTDGKEISFSCGEGVLSISKEKVCLMIRSFENNQP